MKRVILIVLGVVLLLFATPLLVGGPVLAAIGSGDEPNVQGRLGTASSAGHAVVSDALDIGWDYPFADRYDISIGVTSDNAQAPIFVGYGPTASIDAYLTGVPYTLVASIDNHPQAGRDVEVPGTSVPQPPSSQTFWLAQASGTGMQQIVLPPQSGSFRIVAMNADGTAGVNVTVHGSMNLPFLFPLGIGMLVAGLILGLLGVILLVLGIRSKSNPQTPPTGPGGYPQPIPTAGPYPGAPPGQAPGYGHPAGGGSAPPSAPAPVPPPTASGGPPQPTDASGPAAPPAPGWDAPPPVGPPPPPPASDR